ncbi:MAG: hypothetical protein IJ776_05025 [Paludibacteraceae bacterium]|nr:hypothetical protein [Paludibacteraceae bacterium]
MSIFRLPLILLMVCFLSLTSCNRTKPQSPSNRHNATPQDSAAMALVFTQQRLAQEADKIITQYVREHGEEQYVMLSRGYWAKKILKTSGKDITKNSKLELREILFSLEDGRMIIDSRDETEVKAEQMIAPVWEVLQTMHHGEQVELLVPWYLGYGSTGSPMVAPYTNLRIILETY